MTKEIKLRKFLSVDDIQQEYLPVSKKRIRMFAKKYLDYKVIGGKLFVQREQLESILTNPEAKNLPLQETEEHTKALKSL